MNLEETIKWCQERYPELYPTKAHVLEHLYCTIGNGYGWQDGALVRLSKYVESEVTELYHRRHNADTYFSNDKAVRWEARQLRIYPLAANYSKLFTVPDDVNDDFLIGAYKMIRIILLHPINVDNNKALALIALDILNSRFQNRECVKQYVKHK